MESTVYRGVLIVRAFDDRKMRKVDKVVIPSLSQPNNNHKPNNKTTITVGLRQGNRWKYYHHHHPLTPTTNSKLHDKADIEQNSENKIAH